MCAGPPPGVGVVDRLGGARNVDVGASGRGTDNPFPCPFTFGSDEENPCTGVVYPL